MNDQKKLPGYEETQELIRLYRQAGFTDKEIAEELTTINNLLLVELIGGIEEEMSDEEKRKFDEFLKKKPSPEEIARFLQLDQEKIAQEVKSRLQKFISQLKKDME